jgi:hypothetical protein
LVMKLTPGTSHGWKTMGSYAELGACKAITHAISRIPQMIETIRFLITCRACGCVFECGSLARLDLAIG